MMNGLTVNLADILIPTGVLAAIAALFAVLLVFLGKKLSVAKDERVDEILKNLAGANCGACGYPGCEGFAKALAEGKAKLSDCGATPAEGKAAIAAVLGVHAEDEGPTVAVVCCNGGTACENKYEYQGYGNCVTAELLAGGRKACPVGCIGLGSCTDACPHYAIDVNADGVSQVRREKCVSCGACIAACPKKLIRRIPRSAKVYAACSNNCKGKDVREVCQHGCIGCGLCEKNCPAGAITMVDNLPVFDYAKCTGCLTCVEKCPRHCIHHVEGDEYVVRGSR